MYESNLDNTAACSIKHIHDICMVRSSETSGNEDIIELASYHRNTFLMGSSIPGILRSGSCKQDRIHRQRRSVQPHAAQSDSGSDLSDGIYGNRDTDVQRTGTSMEPFCRILLPDYGCIFRFS